MDKALEAIKNLTEDEVHDLLLEMAGEFSIASFIETHESPYKAWPCARCEKERYEKEGWEGIDYI